VATAARLVGIWTTAAAAASAAAPSRPSHRARLTAALPSFPARTVRWD